MLCKQVQRRLMLACSPELKPQTCTSQELLKLDDLVVLGSERRIQDWQEERELLRSTDNKILWHVPAPAMLGAGRTNLLAKLRVFVHTFGLMSSSRAMLSKLLRSITSIHTDYGAEAGLARVLPCELEDVLPYMHLSDCGADSSMPPPMDDPEFFCREAVEPLEAHRPNPEFDEAELFLCPLEPPNQDQRHDVNMCDLTGSLHGPDLNHVIHNVTAGLEGVMSIYKPFVVGLKRVAKLLSGKESKQQLLETCFSSGFAVGFQQEVASFKCSVHEKRWNTIAFSVRSLSELEPALRSCWDVKVYLRGRNMPQAKEDLDGDEHGVHLAGANDALLSDHWWSCLHIFLQVAIVQSAATEYANGCDCHSELLREEVGSDLRLLWESCPLRGRRCPQLVAGEFFTVAQRLFDCSAVRLEADLPRNMAQEQVHELMSDFEAARQYILSSYIMKLSFWGEAPHALAGLGHQDANIRCKYLRKCLQSSSSHPRIQDLKAHEAECLAFLEGGGQWDGNFPFLAALAAELRLMWCSAWRVEGQHARAKRGVTQASNHKAAYVSLCHRLPDLRHFLNQVVLRSLQRLLLSLLGGQPLRVFWAFHCPMQSQQAGSRVGNPTKPSR